MEIRTTQVSMAVYPDEISFHASEFIGLTEQEAHALRRPAFANAVEEA